MADEQKSSGPDMSSTWLLLNSEIGKLTTTINTNNEKTQAKLTEISERLIKLEMQYIAVDRLDKDFKEHVAAMGPIRDEVIVAKRMGRMAAWAAGIVPIIVSGLMQLWHPWNEDTRQQLSPLVARIDSLSDKVTTAGFAITDLQSSVERMSGVATRSAAKIPDPRGPVNR